MELKVVFQQPSKDHKDTSPCCVSTQNNNHFETQKNMSVEISITKPTVDAISYQSKEEFFVTGFFLLEIECNSRVSAHLNTFLTSLITAHAKT